MIRHIHIHKNMDLTNRRAGVGKRRLVPNLEGLAWEEQSSLTTQISRRNDELSEIDPEAGEMFGLIPFPYIDYALAENARIFDELKLEGACIVPVADGHYLDEAVYEPLLEELDSRGARALLHPADTAGVPLINERHLDAVLALSRLFYFDRIRKLPRIEISISHSEGAAEFLADNIGMLYYLRKKRMRLGKFMVDFLFKKRLQGEAIIRRLDYCA